MAGAPSRDEILNHLIEAATTRWGEAVAEELRPALERAAEMVRKVEGFHLEPEEEPASRFALIYRKEG